MLMNEHIKQYLNEQVRECVPGYEHIWTFEGFGSHERFYQCSYCGKIASY